MQNFSRFAPRSAASQLRSPACPEPCSLEYSLPELVASLHGFLRMARILHRMAKYCIKWEFRATQRPPAVTSPVLDFSQILFAINLSQAQPGSATRGQLDNFPDAIDPVQVIGFHEDRSKRCEGAPFPFHVGRQAMKKRDW